MNRDAARRLLENIDPDGAKRIVVHVANELDGLAAQVWAFGAADGPRRAVAIVAQMAAELAVGACQLYEAERWYAGAALVRQLIETEYLLYLFARDKAEPERWLKATEEEARVMFSPKSMRERSRRRFRANEYFTHCEIGGHPRLRGHVLLREHLTPMSERAGNLFDPSVQWVDLAQHVERLWDHYVASVALHSPSNFYPDRFKRVEEAIEIWRASNRAPSRL